MTGSDNNKNNSNEKDADKGEVDGVAQLPTSSSPPMMTSSSTGDDTNIKAHTKAILNLTSSGNTGGIANGTMDVDSGTGNSDEQQEKQKQQSQKEPASSTDRSKATSSLKTLGRDDIESGVSGVSLKDDTDAANPVETLSRQSSPGAFAITRIQGQGAAPTAQDGADPGSSAFLPLAAEIVPDNTQLEEAVSAAQAERDAYKQRLAELERGGVTPTAAAKVVTIDHPDDQNRKCMLLALIGVIVTIGIILAVVFGIQKSGDDNNSGNNSNANLTIPEPEIIEILTTKPPTPSPTPSPTATPHPALPVEDLVGNVVINEIADKGNPLACNSNDYIELKNIGNTTIDLVSLLMSDDDSETVLQLVFPGPNEYVIEAGSILLLCNGLDFPFRIGGDDQITLLHPGYDENNFTTTIIAQVGPMTRGGSETSTYQRLTNGTYVYAFPTPNEETTGVVAGSFDMNSTGSASTFPPTPAPPPAAPFEQVKDVVINEISDKGFEGVCSSADYIELKNLGPADVDLAGLIIHDNDGAAVSGVTLPIGTLIEGNGGIFLLCQGVYFSFGIGGSDTITLLHPNGGVISSVGPMTRGGTTELSYQRLDDGSYQYLPSSPNV